VRFEDPFDEPIAVEIKIVEVDKDK